MFVSPRTVAAHEPRSRAVLLYSLFCVLSSQLDNCASVCTTPPPPPPLAVGAANLLTFVSHVTVTLKWVLGGHCCDVERQTSTGPSVAATVDCCCLQAGHYNHAQGSSREVVSLLHSGLAPASGPIVCHGRRLHIPGPLKDFSCLQSQPLKHTQWAAGRV